MKNVKALIVAAGLIFGSGTASAAVRPADILAGVVTGIVARGGSYAIKDQGGAETGRALLLAACLTGLMTLAYQTNDNGTWAHGFTQVSAAFGTYIVSMYIVPTKSEKTEYTDYTNSRVPAKNPVK